MSADKYPSIFSRQMETIVYIVRKEFENLGGSYLHLIVIRNFDFVQNSLKTMNLEN